MTNLTWGKGDSHHTLVGAASYSVASKLLVQWLSFYASRVTSSLKCRVLHHVGLLCRIRALEMQLTAFRIQRSHPRCVPLTGQCLTHLSSQQQTDAHTCNVACYAASLCRCGCTGLIWLTVIGLPFRAMKHGNTRLTSIIAMQRPSMSHLTPQCDISLRFFHQESLQYKWRGAIPRLQQ